MQKFCKTQGMSRRCRQCSTMSPDKYSVSTYWMLDLFDQKSNRAIPAYLANDAYSPVMCCFRPLHDHRVLEFPHVRNPLTFVREQVDELLQNVQSFSWLRAHRRFYEVDDRHIAIVPPGIELLTLQCNDQFKCKSN